MRMTCGARAWLALGCGVLGGCGLSQVREQSARVEAAGTLSGKVTTQGLPQHDVVVALLRRNEAAELTLSRVISPAADGTFTTRVAAGDYYVGAFVDENHDNHFQPGEPGRFYGKPSVVTVAANGSATVEFQLTPASTPQELTGTQAGPQQPEIGRNMGAVTTLDDPRFDPDNGLLGMWRPFDFLTGPEGGLFLLGEYDPQRIPVLFVHGISDTPRKFEAVIAGLDGRRYQPWVLYYPSGLRLEMVSNGLASAMHQLQRRYGFKQYALVAHSMGGLVARSFLQTARERYPDEMQTLKLFVTVNSPFGGMPSAATAVEHSPIIVPAWQDVASGSEFIGRLQQQALPSGLPYYLVFSFDGDKNGDGVVPLPSQLPSIFQAQATRLYGFQDTHVGTLSDPTFIALLNQLLDQTFAASQPPRVAGPEPASISTH